MPAITSALKDPDIATDEVHINLPAPHEDGMSDLNTTNKPEPPIESVEIFQDTYENRDVSQPTLKVMESGDNSKVIEVTPTPEQKPELSKIVEDAPLFKADVLEESQKNNETVKASNAQPEPVVLVQAVSGPVAETMSIQTTLNIFLLFSDMLLLALILFLYFNA